MNVAAPSAFARHIQCVTKGLERVHTYLDDAIAHDADPRHNAHTVQSLLSRFEKHNSKLASSKARVGATKISFLGHSVSIQCLGPDCVQI